MKTMIRTSIHICNSKCLHNREDKILGDRAVQLFQNLKTIS